MTVGRGDAWGVAFDGPDPPVISSDAALASAVDAGSGTVAWLRGGDLHRTLGRPDRTIDRQALPIDVGKVSAGGGVEVAFVAHLVWRHPFWRGHFTVIANAAHLGEWNIAPRAHPNDGRLDVIEGALSIRDRLAARRRLPVGAHLPHPSLSTSRIVERSWTVDRPRDLWIDGRFAGQHRTLDVRIEPDAATIVA